MFNIPLEPCPFCGGKADVKTWGFKYKQGPKKGEKFQKHKIGCALCGIWQSDVKFAQDAAADWNRRVMKDDFKRLGGIMDNFIEKFWEVVNEEYGYRDMLSFEEIQKIFDHIKE